MKSNNPLTLNIRSEVFVFVFLVTIILTVFIQLRNFSFFIFDDNVYVTDNIRVQNGITLENIRWAFYSTDDSNWHPVTWLSHMLDYQLYGMHPGGHHFTNLFFHILNTLFLFIILNRMTGSLWRSSFVAVLFSIHPMHVESVAWIAERKDVLSTFFWMLTIWCYVRYVEKSNLFRYMLVVLFFILGLMTKAMVVTLPFVLLLLDYWPLKRFALKRDQEKSFQNKYTFLSILIYEKVPLFILAILTSILTYVAQFRGGAVISFDIIPFSFRITNAIISYIIYLYKMILPLNMSILYPYPYVINYSLFILALIVLFIITFAVIKLSIRHRYLIVGWFWYLGTLLPVIGIIQIGAQARADRYTYIPYIGLFIIISWGISSLFQRYLRRKKIMTLFAGIYLITISSIAWIQTGYWSNSIKLFKHTIEVTEHNSVAHNNLGSLYAMNHMIDEAIIHFLEAVKIDPECKEARINLANAYVVKGRMKDAKIQFEEVLNRRPNDKNALMNLALIYSKQKRYDMSISLFQKLTKLQPNLPEPYYYIARIYAEMNRAPSSIMWLKKAVEKGYNRDLIKKDEALKNIRQTDYFKKITKSR